MFPFCLFKALTFQILYPFKSSPEFLRLLKPRALNCMVTSEMQMSTNQILLSRSTCVLVVACFYVLHLPLVKLCSICSAWCP